MAEDVSYWICSCGKSNLKHIKKCASCEKRKPRKWILYGSVSIIVVLDIILLSSPTPTTDETQSTLPESQKDFLSQISSAHAESRTVANSLAFNELLDLRNNQLTEVSNVEGWFGTILGVQEMQGKGGVSIDIGGTTILAGVHLTYGLDTLIDPSKRAIYNELLELRRGDRVQFSGRFVVYRGALVEMSYTGSGAIETPEFLFEFDAIQPAPLN